MTAHPATTTSPTRDAPARGGYGLAVLVALTWSSLGPPPLAAQTDPLYASRLSMVEEQVRQRGVSSPTVLDAMREVPRHLFVPESERARVYEGVQIPFAPGQQLSQPFLSARMIELLELTGDERVLEIGTGSGYDAALLSRVAKQVYTVEIDPALGREAARTLRALGYTNVTVHVGDGFRGLPEHAPYDAILLTTAPGEIPQPLVDQLKTGGRLVAAVGRGPIQDLKVFVKTESGLDARRVIPVRLGKMTGEAETGLRKRD